MTHQALIREVNGVRLHTEERGDGDPILCIHGVGGSCASWAEPSDRLAALGRVISYDRRGCWRSERPEPYERTSVTEHARDAAALLDKAASGPAIVIGRSYGASIALELALARPELVRAIALLEGDAPRELAPESAAWGDELAVRLEEVAARDGMTAVAELFADEVFGAGAWGELPEELRTVLRANAPSILAELRGEWVPRADASALAALRVPALLVSAAESPPLIRAPTEALAAAIPGARTALVGGGHMIDPASPEVMAFVREMLAA